jgi:hypothetical protein
MTVGTSSPAPNTELLDDLVRNLTPPTFDLAL